MFLSCNLFQRFSLVFFLIYFSGFSFSQSQKNYLLSGTSKETDSLLAVLKTDREDTSKVIHLFSLCELFRKIGNFDTGLYFGKAAILLAQQLNYSYGIAVSYNSIGVIYKNLGNYDKALENYFASLKIAERTLEESEELSELQNAKRIIASSYNNIGIIYRNRGNYDKALENYYASIKIREEIGDKKGSAASYSNIGNIYVDQGKYNLALENYFAALKIMEETGDKKGIASSHHNIGVIYSDMGNYEKALENYFATLDIMKETGDQHGIAYSYNNIGNVYAMKSNYEKALENFYASLKIRKEIGDKQGIATAYNNIGLLFSEQGKYDEGLENYSASLKIKEELGDKQGIATTRSNIGINYFKQNNIVKAKEQSLLSLMIAMEIGSKDDIQRAYQTLSLCDSAVGNFKGAYEYHKLYSQFKDSIFNEESSKQMAEMQTRYETEKKEKEIALQKAEIVKKEAVIKQQNIQRIGLASGFALMVTLAFVVFRAYRNKKKVNKIISAQKAEVELQKSIIEEKNKNITDSIEYASYIQRAMLPTDDEFYRMFPEAFILYRPRDIVSGDFYWVASPPSHPPVGGTVVTPPPTGEAGMGAVLLVTADCTGHGVPGAFMSMLCTALLNEAVNDKGITKPNEIFEEVRKGIIAALKQRGQMGGSKDGMDATIIALEMGDVKTPNLGVSTIHATCANNPVYIISNGSLTEMLSDRFPVGVYEGEQKPFTCHDIEVKKGDMIYTITDGFEDQLGGAKGKKFKSAKLKEMLLAVAPKPVPEQKEILEKAFEDWKGNGEQTDDVTVIGIRI